MVCRGKKKIRATKTITTTNLECHKKDDDKDGMQRQKKITTTITKTNNNIFRVSEKRR